MDPADIRSGLGAFLRPIASRLRAFDDTRWWVGVVALIAAAVLVRFLLFQRFPIFFTNDTPDYLRAGELIADELDFLSPHLRDWRAPGYPVFLALLKWTTQWSSASIVVAQKIGGALCVVLGLVSGGSLGWRLGSVLLGGFLAFHPVYLLSEHMAMSEAFFTLLIWVFLTLCVVALGRDLGWLRGLILGTASSACILTRAPGLFFCLPALLGVMLFFLVKGPGELRARFSRLGSFVSGVLLAAAVTVGPWSYRNYLVFGEFSPITNNVQRTLLGYLSLHKVIDPELREIRELPPEAKADPRTQSAELIYRLGAGAEAEKNAGRIVGQQLRERKWEYLAEVFFSLRNYLGLPVPARTPGSSDVTFWFQWYVGKVRLTHRQNASLMSHLSLTYVEMGREGRLLEIWRSAGEHYLDWGRPALTIVFGLSIIVYLVSGGFRLERRDQAAVVLVVVGFLSVAVCHAILLSDKERYAIPWEGLQAFVIVGVGEHLGRRWRNRREGMSQRDD